MAQLKNLIVNGTARILGIVHATKFKGPLEGNADTATKVNNALTINGLTYDGSSAKTVGDTIYYIKGNSSDTTAGTWTGTDSRISSYYDGLTIVYVPVVAGNSTTTLNINGLGAKTCYYNGTYKLSTHYPIGTPILLTYYNEGWRKADYDNIVYTSAYCGTSASTAAKAATCNGFTATANTYTQVIMKYANSVQGAITLNINGTGAKPIYINGAASSSSNYTLPAGSYIVFYDGTNYQFRTDGKLPASISGNANTATSATKATQDSAGQQINTTYIKGLSVSGKTITYTKGNGDTSTITTQDTTYSTATQSANGLMSKDDKTKLDGIATGANKTVVDSALSSTSTNPVQNKVVNTAIGNLTSLVGNTAVATQISTAIASKADLDTNGKVPSSQLPSYVDDVIEYNGKSKFPSTGESGKIYVDTATNLTYRWSGSAYVEISPSLALGETSSTAYRGDRGKTAYDHSQSTHARTDATKTEKSSTNGNILINGTETTVYTHPGSGTNPHGTTKSDVGLGNVGNFKAVSTVASQGLTDTEKSNARANIGAGTSNFSGNYNDLTNKPTIPTVGNGTITIKQAGTSKGTFTMNQSGNTTIELTDNNTDTKVTAVGNHYTPSGGTTTSASGGSLTDITNSSSGVQVVTGVTKDAAGHVTGVTSAALKSVNTVYTHPSAHAASMITEDATHRFVTDTEKTTWNNKASKSTITTTTLLASNWDSSAKTYSFESDYSSTSYNIEIDIDGDNCTDEQLEAWIAAKPLSSSTNKINAKGDIPSIDIPIILTVVSK